MSTFSGIADPPASAALKRLFAFALDRSEIGSARRLAAAAFVARVLNAGLGFATQILLARWMGDREYGIYAYVWVWLLLAGGIGSLGLPVAALKFVPDYRARDDLPGLRGFLAASRSLGLLPCTVAALLAAALIYGVAEGEAAFYAPVALVGLVLLPLYVLTDIQTGIARAYDYMDLGLAADYLLRPALLLGFAGVTWLAGGGGTAVNVMVATLAAIVLTALIQGLVLQGRLRARVPAGPSRVDLRRWADVSWPLLTVTGFTLLLGSTDILVLKLFVGPEEIALYFAATKIIAIASFVSYGVSNTSAHRFAGHMATADHTAMAALAAETVRWTFWPTLVVAGTLAVLGAPLLSLFGPQFGAGYPIVTILGLGLVAGAAVGPADRALAMADHGRLTASIYAGSFVANLLLAIVLIPLFGLGGAAAATALAMAVRAALLGFAVRRTLGIEMHMFARSTPAATAAIGAKGDQVSVELLTPAEAGRISAAWRDLASRALEPNLFYSPEMAGAGLAHLPERRGSRLIAAWRGTGASRKLVGLLPVALPGRRHANPLPIRRAASFYGTLSTPLVDSDRPDDTLRAMLDASAANGIVGILFSFLNPEGAVAQALDRVCRQDGHRQLTLGGHRRAMLRSNLSGHDYVRSTLETRRRKEADRQRRRLGELGTLLFEIETSPDGVSRGLEAFLRLEAAGWKGRAGTALAQAPGGEAFIRQASADLAAVRGMRIATLTLDGRVIAAGLIGVAGRRAFYVKVAYDESFSRFSPGLLLTLDLTAHLLDDPSVDDADSIAVADHPMIDRIWTERFSVTSVLVSTRGGGGILFAAAAGVEGLREAVVARAKALRDKLHRVRQARANDDAEKASEKRSA